MKQLICFFFWCSILILHCASGQKWVKTYTKKAFEGQEIKLSCQNGYNILVTTANYGRTDPEIFQIYNQDQSTVACRTRQCTRILRDMCNKKNECLVEANNSLFGDPCPGQEKYLEVSFMCVSVN